MSFKSTRKAGQKVWAMRTMSLTNGKPTLAKAVVAGITIGNYVAGVMIGNRLRKKNRPILAKLADISNIVSLGLNLQDANSIFKEIDILSGKGETKEEVKTPERKIIYVALKVPTVEELNKALGYGKAPEGETETETDGCGTCLGCLIHNWGKDSIYATAASGYAVNAEGEKIDITDLPDAISQMNDEASKKK